MVTKRVVLSLALAVLMVSGCSRQQSDWEKTRAANTTDAYELFLKKYPNGEFSAQAQARVKELYEERDWQKARDNDTAEDYQAFLKAHPEGKFTEEARIRVENFNLAASNPPGASADAAATPAEPAAPPPAAAVTPAPDRPEPSPAVATEPMAMKRAGAYGIQLGAFRSSVEAANGRWSDLSKEYPTVLSGLNPRVTTKNDKTGALYRLQVPNLSESQARSICKSLSASKQSCTVVLPGKG